MLIIHQGIFSQDRERKLTIQTSPLLLFSDILIGETNNTLFIMDLEGQYKINKSSNISLTLSFLYRDFSFDEYHDSNETTYQIGIKPMYIHRPFDTGLKGFYVGIYPHVGFRYSIIENISKYYTELGFGLNLGYKWVSDSGFTMQIGDGIGKTFSIPKKTNEDDFVNSDGRITIKNSDVFLLDFKLGYSF
jgi:hypothetical protein